MEVFNTSKEAGPLWSHTREACQSPEEADTLSAAGQRAGGAESAGASLCLGYRANTHTYIDALTFGAKPACTQTSTHEDRVTSSCKHKVIKGCFT